MQVQKKGDDVSDKSPVTPHISETLILVEKPTRYTARNKTFAETASQDDNK
jgi:hypothetical protein